MRRGLPRGLTAVSADPGVRLYIRSTSGLWGRKLMIIAKFRRPLSGKQSVENPDAGLH